MDIKQLLATLLAHAEELQSQDVDLLKDVFEAYEFEPIEVEEPDMSPEHEAQETPETEVLEQETGVELGEPLGEVREEVTPAPIPTEVVAEAPVNPLDGITAQLTELKGEIEALKSLLEKVAIREPISEEEAEKDEEDFGSKGKQGQPNLQEPDVSSTLIKKLGGYAR